MKRIAVLGSTGSIGQNTLKIANHLKGQFQVKALAVKENIDLLEQQVKEFRPDIVAIYDLEKAREFRRRMPNCQVLDGMEGLNAAASYAPVDMVISAISGTVGLQPTLAAIQAGKSIGLANKETLVSAGQFVMKLAREYGADIIPIDSEHSAIFQCLQGEKKAPIRRIILTASGGPFRNWSEDDLETVTVEQALNHPTWKMGPKVTIDSSTMMNKGLEVIEAHWLFDVGVDQIEVLIHPQSLIHSMVEFMDGSILAQMGETTMLTPIQYAMTYPKRMPGLLQPFDFLKSSILQFYSPNKEKFLCLELAYEAIRLGGSLPCYMNAANEILVQRFLNREISWKEIAILLEILMARHQVECIDSIEKILAIDALAREEAARCTLNRYECKV